MYECKGVTTVALLATSVIRLLRTCAAVLSQTESSLRLKILLLRPVSFRRFTPTRRTASCEVVYIAMDCA